MGLNVTFPNVKHTLKKLSGYLLEILGLMGSDVDLCAFVPEDLKLCHNVLHLYGSETSLLHFGRECVQPAKKAILRRLTCQCYLMNNV